MSDENNKLSSWLKGKGILPSQKKVSPAEAPKSSAPQARPAHPARSAAQPKGPSPRKPTPKGGRRSPAHGGGGRGGHSGRPDPTRPQRTKNNPDFDRPTFEKKEKFHPTNYLNPPKKGSIRVVPLGGMEQVGMNMMMIEWDNDIIVIDTGLVFPGPEHMGVDALIPDISYLMENRDKIRGVIYTHGHLDHIGGAPYMLPDLGFPPLYTTRLTKEFLLAQCSEHGIVPKLKLNEITPKSKLKLGKFELEFYHVNHSIPDGVGIVVRTPFGSIVHSSDYKFDFRPGDDQPVDLARIADIGKQGVLLALADSTNALKPGHTLSEVRIEKSVEEVIKSSKDKRILLATFASNIGRVSKIIEAAEAAGRTVYLSGRSMERNIAIARKLNYLKCKDRTLQRMSKRADKESPGKVMILCTGSQGEELAALTRMAAGVHKDVKLDKEDTIIFSSSTIPGNELAIVSVLNNLAEIGCRVIDNQDMDIHASGHAQAEDCKLLISLLNPKYFSPIHGEIFMRYGHRDLIVQGLNFKQENTFVMKNGLGLTIDSKGVHLMPKKECISGGDVLVDMGEKIHSQVVEDRKFMAEAGAFLIHIQHSAGIAKKIDIRARGFMHMGIRKDILALVEKEVKDSFGRVYDPARSPKAIEDAVASTVRKTLMQKFRKEPVVEVVI